MDSAPIGVFDSGVGGLTVLKEIQRALPGESTIYLGDNRRAPYGNKPPDLIRRYTYQALDFLVGLGVKALVIACNSATAAALEVARPRYAVPLIGVIEPTARRVARGTSTRVGVIGTEATIQSREYEKAIQALNPEVAVFQQACPRLAQLVEAGELDTVRTALALASYLMPLRRSRVDVLVLGCTHYPFLRGAIERLLGAGVELVESGPPLVEELRFLMDTGVLARGDIASLSHRLLTTGSAEGFRGLASLLWPGESLMIDEIDIEVSSEPILV